MMPGLNERSLKVESMRAHFVLRTVAHLANFKEGNTCA